MWKVKMTGWRYIWLPGKAIWDCEAPVKQAGADVDGQTLDGRTPLHLASQRASTGWHGSWWSSALTCISPLTASTLRFTWLQKRPHQHFKVACETRRRYPQPDGQRLQPLAPGRTERPPTDGKNASGGGCWPWDRQPRPSHGMSPWRRERYCEVLKELLQSCPDVATLKTGMDSLRFTWLYA